METPSRLPARTALSLGTLLVLMAAGCAHDTYQERTNVIKAHVESFYSHLKNNRVEAAVHENERIETLADQMAATVRRVAERQGTTQAQREFALMKTARETAAQNWIALGQYFAIKKQPEQARAAYRRVIDTYTYPAEQSYRDQATRALEDVDILAPAARPTP